MLSQHGVRECNGCGLMGSCVAGMDGGRNVGMSSMLLVLAIVALRAGRCHPMEAAQVSHRLTVSCCQRRGGALCVMPRRGLEFAAVGDRRSLGSCTNVRVTAANHEIDLSTKVAP